MGSESPVTLSLLSDTLDSLPLQSLDELWGLSGWGSSTSSSPNLENHNLQGPDFDKLLKIHKDSGNQSILQNSSHLRTGTKGSHLCAFMTLDSTSRNAKRKTRSKSNRTSSQDHSENDPANMDKEEFIRFKNRIGTRS